MSDVTSSTQTEAQAQVFTAANDDSTAKAFNDSASFLNGRLTPLSVEAVAALHAKFTARMNAAVAAALPDCNDPKLKQAAYDYLIAASLTRQKVTAPQLAEKAAAGKDALQAQTTDMMKDLAKLSQSLERERARARTSSMGSRMARTFSFSGLTGGIKKLFTSETAVAEPLQWDEKNRIYFKLDDASSSPVRPLVESHLAEKGYTITDYEAGRAVDDRKNEWRIGKILKDAPGLLASYTEDPARASKKLMVVLTRDYEDIARGSYGRGWQSCRANASTAVSYAIEEVDCGVMAAYLVSEDDPNIHNPVSRINIKPYDRLLDKSDSWDARVDATDTMYATFNPIGLHHPGFVDAVNRFVHEKFNQGKAGKYKLRKGCESYQEFSTRTLLPQDAQSALKMLKIDYSADEDGKLTVHDDINLRGLGLSRLPDFTDVTVNGSINVTENKLLTLEGLPQNGVHDLSVGKNLLICFAGAPAEISGTFDYKGCPWLMSAHGAPKASEYAYGNSRHSGERHEGKGDTLVCPTKEPQRFPGFKRAK